MTIQTQDPAVLWADLLQELVGPRLEATVAALRHSANSGWPASRESVVSLIAYAQGRIGSMEYAAQTLVALGLADVQTAAALLRMVRAPAPPPTSALPTQPTTIDAGVGAEFLFGGSERGAPDQPALGAGYSAAETYLAGRSSTEDFLRGRTP